jgi:Asp-tRNA(Asn)/Glu-tRNA(Gln) amidotransferase A subunit family amidase
MTDPMPDQLRRRSFLAYCGSLGLGSTLFPGALWAQTGETQEAITAEMIHNAARLAGLHFSEADVAEMVEGVNANVALYGEPRALEIDQNVAPPLYFNPAVPGQTFPTERRPFRLAARPDLRRPTDLEEVAFWPLTHLAWLIESRQVSALELTRMYLARLRRHDPLLECVVTLTEELALEQAERADRELAEGRYRGTLHGIPWGAKDLLAKRGYPTTWGSEAYREQVIDMDATVVQRLEEAGAVLVAKLSTGEIARGDRWFGGKQTKNPWKPDEGSGGSSAGPGAATAAGLVGFSIGSETTGSILGPSRTCGVTGLRPTFGRVSRHGVMPVSWSLDKVGPICRSVEDCAVVLEAIRGPDGQDLAVTNHPFNWDGNRSLEGIQVGYLREAFEAERRGDDGDAVRTNDLAALDVLRGMGVDLRPVRLPESAGMNALQMLLVDEAAAFDELVLTGRVDLLIQERNEPEDMLMRVARLIPAVEYLQMNRQRMLMMQETAEALQGIDVYLAPHGGGPTTSANNLTGHPGITVPNGFAPDGTPTGIIFVGQLYAEAEAMTVAKAYQEATDWHTRRPEMQTP